MKKRENPHNDTPAKMLVEGLDFYLENGLMVLTDQFLRERGYCCGNGCRHCPYQTENRLADQSRNSSNSL